MARYASAANTPQPGGLLLYPLILLGRLLHLGVFRRRWTVAVTRSYNLAGPMYRERADCWLDAGGTLVCASCKGKGRTPKARYAYLVRPVVPPGTASEFALRNEMLNLNQRGTVPLAGTGY
jgi:hypothetical protein